MIESQLLSFSTLVRSLSLSLTRILVGGLVAERYLTVYTQASPRRYKRVYDAVMHLSDIEYETLLARDGQTYVDHEPPRSTGKAYSLLLLGTAHERELHVRRRVHAIDTLTRNRVLVGSLPISAPISLSSRPAKAPRSTTRWKAVFHVKMRMT